MDTAITNMSACSVNYWLSKFVQEVLLDINSNYSNNNDDDDDDDDDNNNNK